MMRPDPRLLEWLYDKEGWWARTDRDVGGRYLIEPRYKDDGTSTAMFDVLRLDRSGPRRWKSHLVGTTLNIDTAKAVAQKNYERLVAS